MEKFREFASKKKINNKLDFIFLSFGGLTKDGRSSHKHSAVSLYVLSLLVYQLETVKTNRFWGKFVTTLSNLIEFYCEVISSARRFFFLLCHSRTREDSVKTILKNSIKISRHGRE